MRTIWQESVLEIKIIKELMISFLSFFFTMVPIFSSVILLLINSILEFGPLNFMLVSSNKLANESVSEMTGTPQREQPPSGGGGGGLNSHSCLWCIFFIPYQDWRMEGGRRKCVFILICKEDEKLHGMEPGRILGDTVIVEYRVVPQPRGALN